MSASTTSSDRPPEDGRRGPAVRKDARGAFSSARRPFRGAATGLASALVLVALLWPGNELPEINAPGLDKLAHVALFALWSLALRYDFRAFRSKPVLLVATAFGFGLAGEALQILATSRSFDLFDVSADLAGGALVAAASSLARRRRNGDRSGGEGAGAVSSNR